MIMVKPSTSRLIREALSQGPKCAWDIYQYVKNKPAHYKREHITYKAIYNMLYVLKKLGLVRKLSSIEVKERGLDTISEGVKRIKSRYVKTFYELVNLESEAWNNPYKAYSRVRHKIIQPKRTIESTSSLYPQSPFSSNPFV